MSSSQVRDADPAVCVALCRLHDLGGSLVIHETEYSPTAGRPEEPQLAAAPPTLQLQEPDHRGRGSANPPPRLRHGSSQPQGEESDPQQAAPVCSTRPGAGTPAARATVCRCRFSQLQRWWAPCQDCVGRCSWCQCREEGNRLRRPSRRGMMPAWRLRTTEAAMRKLCPLTFLLVPLPSIPIARRCPMRSTVIALLVVGLLASCSDQA